MTNNNFMDWKKKTIQAIDKIKPIPRRIRQARIFRAYTVKDFADELDVSRQSIYAYERGTKNPSDITLGRMVEVTNLPISFFTKPLPETRITPLNYRSYSTSKVMAKEMINVFSEFVEEMYLYLKNYIDYPKVNLLEILDVDPGCISDEKIEDIACNLRTYWNLGFGPISNITRLMEKNGIIVSKLYFGDKKIDACSYWSQYNRPIILLSSDKKCAVRNRFDMAHELGHLLLHKNLTPDQMNDKEFMEKIEHEANRFAGAFLLPYKIFPNEILTTSLNHFISLKERWLVSIAAMIYRCSDLGIFNENQVLNLRKNMATKKMLSREPLDDILIPEEALLFKKSIQLLLEHNIQSIQDILNDYCMYSDDIEKIACLPSGMLAYDDKVIPLIRLKNRKGKTKTN